MSFRKKAAILGGLVAALAIANLLTFVFDPGKPRSSSLAWLDTSLIAAADHIEIHGRSSVSGSDSDGPIVLVRRNNRWLFRGADRELPVKQARVDDLLSALSRKAVYPRRAVSSEARAALVLEEGRSSRIIVRGGAGLPLLDLLIGTADALGREVYLRKAGQNEIHSGEDFFTVYTESKPVFWYDLKLFPGSAVETRQGQGAPQIDTGIIAVDAVQQAEVKFFEAGFSGEDNRASYMLRRQRGNWVIPGDESAVLDAQRVDTWLRTVLEAEAEDFGLEAPAAFEQSITLRLGDGSTRIIQTGFADETKRRSVVLTGSDFVYVLSEWTADRLFRELPYFVKTE